MFVVIVIIGSRLFVPPLAPEISRLGCAGQGGPQRLVHAVGAGQGRQVANTMMFRLQPVTRVASRAGRRVRRATTMNWTGAHSRRGPESWSAKSHISPAGQTTASPATRAKTTMSTTATAATAPLRRRCPRLIASTTRWKAPSWTNSRYVTCSLVFAAHSYQCHQPIMLFSPRKSWCCRRIGHGHSCSDSR